MRGAAVRYYRGDPGGDGNPRRLCASTANRAGPVGRNLAVRGRAGADVLAIGNCIGDRSGSARHGVGAFEASDGWIVVGGANHKNWLRMLEALNAPALADDPRFKSSADRMAHL